MRAPVLLRTAAVICLLFAAGHTLGGRKDWSPMGETPVLEQMRTVSYPVMGQSRTYLDFYRGFGYALSVDQVLSAVLLWLLAGIAKTSPTQARPLIAAFAVAQFAGAYIAWRYIIPIPAVLALVLGIVLVLAFVKAR
jgi:hypothetical protein